MITSYGLEAGAIYPLANALRRMPSPRITIDFKPSLSERVLIERLGQPRIRPLLEAQRKWRLSETVVALLDSLPERERLGDASGLAAIVKECPLNLSQFLAPSLRPSHAAGGVRWSEIDERLMLHRMPGSIRRGEMIDWEAPTGGYLLQGCLATGTRAGLSALEYAKVRAPAPAELQ
jgi:predicted flavoprotein YhiN